MKTAILGAGVSGLALARTLIDGGLATEDVHLFEAGPVAGGLCASKTVEGFTYDTSGGHVLFSKDGAVMQWMKDHAGGDDAFVETNRNTKIRFEDRWVHYPFENGLGDLPKQANFDCLAGYVEAWHERDKLGTTAPADFGSWIAWRFGDGIARHFMNPYNEKIWKRPLSEITSEWVAGRVPDAPIEDVIRASIGIETDGYLHQAVFYYPKTGGFQSITDGLARTLEQRIRLSTRVERVERVGDRWSVDGEDFDRVVSTLPLNELPSVVANMPAGVAAAMRGLEYNGITCFLLALDRAEHPDLSWVYLPHHAQGPANRITYISNYSPENAPAGKSSFLCEVTSPGGAPLPPDSLGDEVIDGMAHAGLLTRDEVLFTDRSDHKYAYIVYDHGFRERKAAVLAWLDEVGLIPLGRFGRYEYFNSDQCTIAARELAERMLAEAVHG